MNTLEKFELMEKIVRELEDLQRGDPEAGFLGAGDDLNAEDRVAADGEEVVVHSHGLDPED